METARLALWAQGIAPSFGEVCRSVAPALISVALGATGKRITSNHKHIPAEDH